MKKSGKKDLSTKALATVGGTAGLLGAGCTQVSAAINKLTRPPKKQLISKHLSL